ncbi:unnamed protein product [Sympodiomycopsis kandeliae]
MPPKSRRSRATPASASATPDVEVDIRSPDFAPESLRVPELRALLANHNIRLPSSARKADLVRAVNESVLATIPVKADEDSIEDEDKKEAELEAQAQARARAQAEAEALVKQEEEQEAQRQRLIEADAIKSAATPARTATPLKQERNFSNQNPFQRSPSSAESPGLSEIKPKAKSARKSVPAHSTELPPQKSTANRRKTMDPNALAARQHLATPSYASSSSTSSPSSMQSRAFQPYMDPTAVSSTPPRKQMSNGGTPLRPRSSMKKPAAPPAIPSQPDSEASTSDELEDDDMEQADQKKKAKPRGKSTNRNIVVPDDDDNKTSTVLSLTRWLCMGITLAWWTWYTRESKVIGYCDTSSDSNALLVAQSLARSRRSASDEESINLTDLIPTAVRPSCTPCPAHAVCQGGSMESCISSEYIYRPSILSSVPMLPLQWQASYCRTDSRRLELIDELASEVATRLGTHAGQIICGGRPDVSALSLVASSERDAAKFALREADLFEQLSDERDPEAISGEYFQHLWDNAVEELQAERVMTKQNGVLIPSRSIAVIPLSCRIKLALQNLLKAVSLYILGGLTFFATILWARHRFTRSRSERKKVDELVSEVLDRLSEQQLNSLSSPSSSEPTHLPVNHLRDQLLPNVSSRSRRRIWNQVAKAVESNANVRTGMKRWKGDWTRGWEWVGVSSTGRRSIPGTPAGTGTPRGSETVIVHDDSVMGGDDTTVLSES